MKRGLKSVCSGVREQKSGKEFDVGCRSSLSQLYNDGILCCTILLMAQSESKDCCVELNVVSLNGQASPHLNQRLCIMVVNGTSNRAGRMCTCV
jgi:hypothetical protein